MRFIILCILLIPMWGYGLQLYEVYPDPIGDEKVGEYFVLYTNASVQLSNYHLSTPSGNISLPNTMLYEKQYFMIASNGFVKDNLSWPDTDYETKMTLRNTDGWIALYEKNEEKQKISWKSTTQGLALRGLEKVAPDPKNRAYSFAQEEITIELQTQEAYFTAQYPTEAFYLPGKNMSINLTFNTSCPNISIEWLGEQEWFSQSAMSKRTIHSKTTPGQYIIQVNHCTGQENATFTVHETIGIEKQNPIIVCAIALTQTSCMAYEYIKNIGNVPVHLTVYAQDNIPPVHIGEEMLNTTIQLQDTISVGETYTLPLHINATNITPGNHTYKLRVHAHPA